MTSTLQINENESAETARMMAGEACTLLNSIHGMAMAIHESCRQDHGIDTEYITEDELAMLRQVSRRIDGIYTQLVEKQVTDEDYRDELEADMLVMEEAQNRHEAQMITHEAEIHVYDQTISRQSAALLKFGLDLGSETLVSDAGRKASTAEFHGRVYSQARDTLDNLGLYDTPSTALLKLEGEVTALRMIDKAFKTFTIEARGVAFDKANNS